MKQTRYEGLILIAASLVIMFLVLFLLGCTGPKKTQGQKDYEARIERQQTLEAVRKQFPCDTGKLMQGKVILSPQYIYVDNPVTGKRDKYDCPPAILRVDTLPVYDMALLQIVRDSVDNLKFLLDGAIKAHDDQAKENNDLKAKISDLKPFRTKYTASIIIGSLIGLFFIARRFKII